MDTFFQLSATNLADAIGAAIDYAGDVNSENHNACCLRIYDDSTFWIIERCYSNTSYSGRLMLSGKQEKDSYNLTVAASDYSAGAWEFGLLEFCARYSIKVSDRVVKDIFDNVRPAAWDKVSNLLVDEFEDILP
jgi:hypothetical protein